MQYFGIPSCPYCRKRINLIRIWSLKRQGEYQCPRCSGISNIYLSPLIYVFALLAVFSGGALYFFHKFVLDDVSLSTIWQVALPFAVFFLVSLFLVYLEKPVIKKVPKAELQKGRRKSPEERPVSSGRQPSLSGGAVSYDSDEYLPKGEYRTGTIPKMGPSPEAQHTSVVELPKARPVQRRPEAYHTEDRRPAQGTARPASALRTDPSFRPTSTPAAPGAAVPVRTARSTVSQSAVSSHIPATESVRRRPEAEKPDPQSFSSGDFFSKYDDPEYVERRLKEIREKKGPEG